ncbi:MAG: Cys-tRNA(Pro) deacylase [Phaeodactylibacter sp.]|nr:Cys-tRNA(Pro) deacylase [Phaeodactylibacter sp.]
MPKKTNALRILDARKIPYETIEYEYETDGLSVEHIAQANSLPLERIYKTLVAKGDRQGVVVAVIPGHRSLSFKALALASGDKKITLAPVKDIQALTGYIRGGCSPVGMKKAYPVFIDSSALTHDRVFVNAGQRGLLACLSPQNLQEATGGVFVELSE